MWAHESGRWADRKARNRSLWGKKKKKLNLSCGTDVGFCHCGITRRAACALGSHIFWLCSIITLRRYSDDNVKIQSVSFNFRGVFITCGWAFRKWKPCLGKCSRGLHMPEVFGWIKIRFTLEKLSLSPSKLNILIYTDRNLSGWRLWIKRTLSW